MRLARAWDWAGKKQMDKNAREVVEAEQLNIFIGSIPINDKKVKEKVKLNILDKLNKKYGITEEDFGFAELCFVPAGKATDIGFDKSMIAAYGHDDKSASFAALKAFHLQ